MFCVNCGNKLEDGAKFCSGCGGKVDGTAQTNNKAINMENENKKNHISDEAVKKSDDKTENSFFKKTVQKNKLIPKTDQGLIMATVALVGNLDNLTDKSLPEEIAKIVKSHSKGAAIAAVGSGLIFGVGGTAAVAACAGFIWSMYLRINKKLGLTISKTIIKTIASGVATNLAMGAAGDLIFSTLSSFIPVVGQIAAPAISGVTYYALTLASGFIYIKILTNVFKEGKDPSTLSPKSIKEMVKTVLKNENIKEIIKEAKADYKIAKENGDLDDKENVVTIEEGYDQDE